MSARSGFTATSDRPGYPRKPGPGGESGVVCFYGSG